MPRNGKTDKTLEEDFGTMLIVVVVNWDSSFGAVIPLKGRPDLPV